VTQHADVATSSPSCGLGRELEKILKLEVKFVFANPADIRRFLGEFYTLARSMKKTQETSKGQVSLARSFEQLVELGRKGTLDANDSHVVHIVDWLWQYAFEQRASDIHVEPRRDAGVVRFRIDGVLHQVYAIPIPVLIAMTSRIKLLARMEIVEKRRPQDGRIKTVTPDGNEVELRISTMPTAFGEKIVMRIFRLECWSAISPSSGSRRTTTPLSARSRSRTASFSSPDPRARARRRRSTRR
jgi:general secretion pathway protein E